MENKYLVKIAAAGDLKTLMSAGKTVAKSVVGVGKDIVNGIGRDVHTAMGGGFREAANAKGVKLQSSLRNIHDKDSLLKATKGVSDEEISALQHNKNKAIIKSIGYAGGTAYAGNKILSKVKEQNQPQYY